MTRHDEPSRHIPAQASPRTMELIRKEMSCKWHRNDGNCAKGLPGTPCSIIGCVARIENPDTEQP